MLAVVIPAYNEEASIAGVLGQVLRLKVDLVIPVLNGCTDRTLEIVREMQDPRIWPLFFEERLGLDVPRIAGARLALQKGAKAVLFVDGDLKGDLTPSLWELLLAVQGGVDLALMDCYVHTQRPKERTTAGQVYAARLELNRVLRRPDLGAAVPSHGPSAVSRRLLLTVPIWPLGMPPVLQALAVQEGLRVEVSGRMAHRALGSAVREPVYRKQVAHTIIGDCIAAQHALVGGPLLRSRGAEEFAGLHGQRRFDLLGLVPALAEEPAAEAPPVASRAARPPAPAPAPAPPPPPPPPAPAPPPQSSPTPLEPPAPPPALPRRRRRRRRRKSDVAAVGTLPSQAAQAGQRKRGGLEHAGDRARP